MYETQTICFNQVHNALGHDKLCSAFQIRYGGYKGMLVTDPTLKDAQIVFRSSMKKFNSPQNTRLEIAKTSAPGENFLPLLLVIFLFKNL
jgi:RNA-dependent RNA polymerase